MRNIEELGRQRMVQARSKRGSRRLPHERSSEISKNYHKNSDSHSPIYMCVEINRAGVFGPKIFPFRTLTCNSHFPIYMRVEKGREDVFYNNDDQCSY